MFLSHPWQPLLTSAGFQALDHCLPFGFLGYRLPWLGRLRKGVFPTSVNERSENSGLWESRGSLIERKSQSLLLDNSHSGPLLACYMTLCDPVDCSPPGSSVHGILQARTLEWLPISSSGDMSYPGIEPRSSSLQTDFLLSEPPGKPSSKVN